MKKTKLYVYKSPEKGLVDGFVGDLVIDVYGDLGIFIVEEIREDNWIWGSGMSTPYCKNGEKNFMDNHFAWKLKKEEHEKSKNSINYFNSFELENPINLNFL